MRVLTVVTEAPPIRSGISKVAGKITDGLRDLGHSVDVVTSVDVGRRHFGEVRVTAMAPHWKRLRAEFAGYDVVNLHGPAPTFSDVFLALWRTIPRSQRPGLVYTHHSDIHLQGVTPLCDVYNWMHSRLTRAASHVVVSTPSYEQKVRLGGARRVAVVPFGIETGDAPLDDAPPRNQQFTVAFIGQLRPYKGVDVLLRAASSLPDVRFEIAGSGHQQAALHQMAAELRLDNVVFHGSVSDDERNAILARSHVICLPSLTRAEAFGIVLLEGMRAGCVPVASDLPGVLDVAGESGLLARTGDPRSLVEAIAHLRDHPAEWRHRSIWSRQVAARHVWDDHTLRYNQILSESALHRHLRHAVAPSLDRAMSFVREGLIADRASLMLLEPSVEQLRLVAVSGRSLPAEAFVSPAMRRGYAGQALTAGEPVHLTAAQMDPRIADRRRSVRAALLVPFDAHRGMARGVINLSRADDRDFSDLEIRMAMDWVPMLASRTLDPRAIELPLAPLVSAAA